MTVQQAQQAMTSKEFVEWTIFLDREFHEDDKEAYRTAQIVAEIKRSYVRYPRKVKVEDQLLRFTSGKVEKKKVEQTPEQRTAMSKLFWFSVAGHKPKEN